MKIKAAVIGLLALANIAAPASATLLVNGGFEHSTSGTGQLGALTNAIGWSSGGYNFLFDGLTADTAGAASTEGALRLWGPANGYENGLGPSPDGGNFVAADGNYLVAPIEQTLSGLTVGQSYDVSFYWAAAQQYYYFGDQTQRWQVSFGDVSRFTDTYLNPTGGFSGWMFETFTFTASSVSQILSFLAEGTPDGVPPFVLLDGVSVTAGVPEAPTWTVMLAGLGLAGLLGRRRRAKA